MKKKSVHGHPERLAPQGEAMLAENIYDRQFVSSLFDEMASTYSLVNTLSSFGFCHRWRRQCINQVVIEKGNDVADLMSGMGELIQPIDRLVGTSGSILSVDFSSVMSQYAEQNTGRCESAVSVRQTDALDSGVPDQSLDVIVSCFGLKTLSDSQLGQLATEVHRMLRPGGRFSFLEISVPPWPPLRATYAFYLHHLIPIIGKLLLGNPENYRMLGVYTDAFSDCTSAASHFRKAGLETKQTHFFFRCATGIVGCRPC